MIKVQHDDFDHAKEYSALQHDGASGAIVTFTGLVRDFTSRQADNPSFELQHYPGMTEKTLHAIETRARKQWQLQKVSIIHRIGTLIAGDHIVFVGVSSQHRCDAFAAAEFIMDMLKTEAPFWKKEGGHWVEAKASDQQSANRWLTK